MDRMGWTRGVRQLLVALSGLTLAAAGPAAAQAPADPPHDAASCARPSLWVVSDADTTIYLFGTIHTHDGVAHWFDHAVRRAFDASSTLVLETLIPAERPATTVAAPEGSGLTVAKVAIQSARQAGLSVRYGADMVLARAADASGKPMIGLESFDEQLRMYQSLPSPARPAAPAAAASHVAVPAPAPALAPYLRTMVDRWNAGDSGPIEAVVGEVRRQSPEAYRRLFTDRNTAWAHWIAQRLKQPGTVFVAVGTGHLVGADSVQAKLAANGIRTGRIN
ncbi:TraB/GumN family protein [Sphingomonas sp. LHG3443-2]|uniref:TraB/GumN family protein n=1 Tax=Sphingomonas sp. LHG3443-2 TaxID=2804639 RepID=UPI003CF570B3